MWLKENTAHSLSKIPLPGLHVCTTSADKIWIIYGIQQFILRQFDADLISDP